MNKYLIKIARRSLPQNPSPDSQEKPHVIAAHEKLDKNKGLIVHWGTGSGKTKFFLDAANKALQENKRDDALIVAPASLVTNVDKELKKHKIKLDRKRLQVYSYEKANNISDELKKKRFAIAIADEAHKLRNAKTQRAQSLTEIFSKADKKVLSTATANYNHAADIAPLINIAAGYEALPTDRAKFENRYIRKGIKPQSFFEKILRKPLVEEKTLSGTHELKPLFKDHVHHYDPKEDPAAKDKFPTVTEKSVYVDMSPRQLNYYRFMEGQIPFWLRMKIRHNLPLDKQEKSQLNSFSQGVRQASNSYRHLVQNSDDAEYTPKMTKAVSSLQEKFKKDKNFRGLVYSNYLDAGVKEYSKLLKEKGIKHGVFTGELSREEKDKIRDDYNSGKIPVILVSSSGSEGLDLKGTKLVQILDQHFNKAKLRQVIGRGSRYESHEHLPKEERVMEVEHYLSTHPKGLTGSAPASIDVYLKNMSEDKDEIFDQIKGIIREQS